MKLLYKLFLFLLLIIFSSSIIAQRFSIDSLKKALQSEKEDTDKVNTMATLSWNLSMNGNFKDAIQNAQNSLSLAEKINYAAGKADAFWSMGVIYNIGKMPDSALKNYSIALKLYQQLKNKWGIGITGKYIAIIYQNEENFSEAIVYYYVALKAYEESENKHGIATSFSGIGFNNFYIHNYDESLKNFQLCLKVSREINYDQGIADSYIYISKIYTLQEKYDAALKIDSIVLKISDSTSDQHSIGNAYFEIGYNFQKLSDAYKTFGKEAPSKEFLIEAEKDLLKAVGCFKETDSGALGDTYSQLGSVYTSLHKFSEAQKYFEMAIQTGKGIKYNDNLKTAYEGLTRLDSAEGNYHQAYKILNYL